MDFIEWRRQQRGRALHAWIEYADEITQAAVALQTTSLVGAGHSVECGDGAIIRATLLSKGTWAQPVRITVCPPPRRSTTTADTSSPPPSPPLPSVDGAECASTATAVAEVSMVLKPRTDNRRMGSDVSQALYEHEGTAGLLINELHHPGFVHTLHVTDRYIIMEYIDGMSLHSLIWSARTMDELLLGRCTLSFILTAVACTLNYAQTAQGGMAFTHNDLSTNNVRMWCLPEGVTLDGVEMGAGGGRVCTLRDAAFTMTHPSTGARTVVFPVIIDFAESAFMHGGMMYHKSSHSAITERTNMYAVAMGMTPEFAPMSDLALLCTHVMDTLCVRFFPCMKYPENKARMQHCLAALIDATGMPPARLLWCMVPYDYAPPDCMNTVRDVRKFAVLLLSDTCNAWVPFMQRPVLHSLNPDMAPHIPSDEIDPNKRRFFHTLCSKNSRLRTHASHSPWDWIVKHATEGAWLQAPAFTLLAAPRAPGQ